MSLSQPPNQHSGHAGRTGMAAPLQPDPYDRDPIGRMRISRSREPSVNSQLARRLAGFKGFSSTAGKARRATGGAGQAARFSHMQRVVVKVHVSRHRPGKVHGSVLRHVSYLGRESASLDGQRGVFYDAGQGGLDARQIVQGWEQDRHHFRLIVSQESTTELPDSKDYIRRVMTRMERDLGTSLQWLAVDHYNTDNPHSHVLVRGRKQDGADLVIPRQYIARGIRFQASEIATEILGPRTAEQERLFQDREVEATRFTSLDRTIERCLEDGQIDMHPDKPIGFSPDDRVRVLRRLQFLQTMDLAKKGRGTWWILDEQFGSKLRSLGQRNDIIKTLYPSLGLQSIQVELPGRGVALPERIAGVLVTKGSVDEIGERRFVVVRDDADKLYYHQVPDDDNFRRAQPGAVVELGAKAHEQRLLAQEIITVAQRHNGVYAPAHHAAFLTSEQPSLTPDQTASRISSATAKLTFVVGHKGSGVAQMAENQFQIDAPGFERYAAAQRGRTDLRVLDAHNLQQQVQARAFTGLDRQLLQPRAAGETAQPSRRRGEYAEALEGRGQWLVAKGLAEFTGPDQQRVTFKPGAIRHLQSAEYRLVLDAIAEEFSQPTVQLPREIPITGEYVGLRELHSDPVALIKTSQQVYMTRWTRQFSSVRPGNSIAVRLDQAGKLTLEAARSRTTEASLGSGLQRGTEELELDL